MRIERIVAVGFLYASFVAAQQVATSSPSATTEPSTPAAALTIYNQDFAVVRTTIPLNLHIGSNEVSTNEVTSQLEPDSVVLRDLAPGSAAKPTFRIAEQNYDAAVITQDWLLQKYEGKTIPFLVGNYVDNNGQTINGRTVSGKIIRAGQPATYGENGASQRTEPLIEVDGHMQFQLPGVPLFPASTDGLLLKPTLRWLIDSDKAQNVKAELAYITGGFTWEATYNVVVDNGSTSESRASSSKEQADLVGWVTITNRSGAEFPEARIKLMAGDVAKITPRNGVSTRAVLAIPFAAAGPSVTQKPFDDFHLYDLNRTVSLRNGETKQIQFLDKQGITVTRSYVYDGSAQDFQPWNGYNGNINTQQNFGLDLTNHKVQISNEIKNTAANHLGIPLPAGRIRLYRRDSDGQMEFIGESTINHTPAEDTIHLNSGSAFDIKGSRRQTNFVVDNSRRTLDEDFEITLTNQKDEAVDVSVLEHMYRGETWEIRQHSTAYNKIDSQTVSFPVSVPAKGEATVTYSVHYSW